MIKFENTQIFGWEAAIRGMRNPKNSWDRSDSHFEWNDYEYDDSLSFIGPKDLELMKKLAKAGDEHSKYLRMIQVYVDITAPIGWWHDFDTYSVGVVKNSCSRRHDISERPFTIDDFSTDHLSKEWKNQLESIIERLNSEREIYLRKQYRKEYYREIIDMLPSCYNQKATWMGNYQTLARIYRQRKNHIYDEFHQMCRWIESLSYSEIITGENKS